MPGNLWLRWSRAWFDERTVERVFRPLVADWQHDTAASQESRSVKKTLRWQLAIARSFGVCFVHHLRRPLPPSVLRRAWLAGGLFAIIGMLLLAVVFERTPPVGPLLPAYFGLSIPLALVPLLVYITRNCDADSQSVRWLAMRAGLLVLLVMVPLAGWIIPASNQVWRQRVASARGYSILPGPRELTLPQLFGRDILPRIDAASRRLEAHNRVSLILTPLTLCAFGLAASRRGRRPLRGALAWWFCAGALWLLSVPLANGLLRRTMFEIAIAWTPQLVLLCAVVLLRRSSNNPPTLART